jgi:hypothetical protein
VLAPATDRPGGLSFGDPHHHAWERRRAQAERFTGPGSAVQEGSLRGRWSSRRSLHKQRQVRMEPVAVICGYPALLDRTLDRLLAREA